MLRSAPENLAAIRGIAEIHHRRGQLGEALGFYRRRSALAKHDPDLEQTVDEISRALSPERPPIDDGLSFEQAQRGVPGGARRIRSAGASRERRIERRSHRNRAPAQRFPSWNGFSTPFTPTASGGRSKILPCASLLATPSRPATPGFEQALRAADLDGLVVTHLPNVFYLTNFSARPASPS